MTGAERDILPDGQLARPPDQSAPLAAAGMTPLTLIQVALEKGIDPEQLGRLMDLQERWERNRAAEAFGAAITRFQAECPPVTKRRTVGGDAGSKITYRYASYDDVMRAAAPVLTACGLAVSFSTKQQERMVEITCRIRVGIHHEDHTVTVPVPDMRVNDTQKFGAAISYGKRFALCAALNIVVTDEDNDAQALIDTLLPAQVGELERLIKERGADLKRFLAWANVESLGQMLRKDFANAAHMLRQKKAVTK